MLVEVQTRVYIFLNKMATDKGAKKEKNLSSTTLFVRNLPFTFDNKELEKVFSEVGPVKRCFVVKDKGDPSKCRGFGYVTFALKEDAILAQEKIRQVNGRKVFITFSNKKPRHIQRGPPEKNTKEDKSNGNKDEGDVDSATIDTPIVSHQAEKPKHKPKSKRASALNNDGRTVVLTGFSSTFKIKQLKKACKKNGDIEQFVYPVETETQPTAHVVYKSHKEARKAVNNLNKKTVKGEVLNAGLRSKMEKNLSQKSLKKSRLIVRNLPFKCSVDLLKKNFSKFGEISEIVLPTKMVGKRKKKLGFAFVQFKNVFDAAKALENMNGKEIKGRTIAVDWTLPKKKYELMKVSEDIPQDNKKDQKNDDVTSNGSREEFGEDGGGSEDLGGDSDDEGSRGDDGDSSGDDGGGSDDDGGSGGDDGDSSGEDDDNDGIDDGDNEGSDSDGASVDNDDDDDDDDDDDGTEGRPKKKKRKLRDAREGKTIFIRNLPYDAGEEAICAIFEAFGEIDDCKIVVDRATQHSRGTAFVKFREKQSADVCLMKYGSDSMEAEELTMNKRPLEVCLAVTKGKMPQLLADKDTIKKTPRDKRNLYLAKEGVITPGSEAADGMSKSDLQKRQKAEAEKKAKLKMPHYVVSKTRLCFRNLPLHIDDKKLSEVLRTVCDGKPKTVRKVRIMRNMERVDSSGLGRSKGFGFAEFTKHEDALDVLRATNNNPKIFGPDRRPIVEFAIENSLILKRLEERKVKYLQKVKPKELNIDVNPADKKRKRERKGHKKRKVVRKDENGNNVHDNSITTTETVSSNENLSTKLKRNSKGNVLKNKKGRKKNKVSGSESKNLALAKENERTRSDSKEGESRMKRKRKAKNDREEEKFNEIVEKYKTKLFGGNKKQFKTSRWFDTTQ